MCVSACDRERGREREGKRERGRGEGRERERVLKLGHQGYQKSKRNLVYGIWSQ